MWEPRLQTPCSASGAKRTAQHAQRRRTPRDPPATSRQSNRGSQDLMSPAAACGGESRSPARPQGIPGSMPVLREPIRGSVAVASPQDEMVVAEATRTEMASAYRLDAICSTGMEHWLSDELAGSWRQGRLITRPTNTESLKESDGLNGERRRYPQGHGFEPCPFHDACKMPSSLY